MSRPTERNKNESQSGQLMRYWQDIVPGEAFTTQRLEVSEADILEFAAEFDPQPYHLDRGAAQESIFGGLCASGWQVTALMMRLITDAMQKHSIAILGSSGVKKLRWKMPVFAGDTLSARLEIVACEPSTEPGLGNLECSIEMLNQDGKPVLVSSITMLAQLSTQVLAQAGGENE